MSKKAFLGLTIAVLLCAGLAGTAFAQSSSGGNASLQQTQELQAQSVKASESKPAKPSKKQLTAFKKASADFAIELLQRSVAARGKNANVTVSPISVMNALAMTANGASGKTQAQMRKVLADGASMATINANLSWYNSQLTNTKNASIRSANSIWYHNDGTLVMKNAFLNKAKKFYDAEVNPADFGDPATVKSINSWVYEKTNGFIRRITSQLQPEDRIAIINALYFDAKWKSPFEPTDTDTRIFTKGNGKKGKVKMMHGTVSQYIEGKNVKGFVKPYIKGYSYVALLPKKGISLKKYVASLDGTTFRKLVSGASDAHVVVWMPKHTLLYNNEGLERQLAAMGMKLAVSKDADFSKMGDDSAGNLYIGSVVHKTRVEVDEEGTKAAAVTGVIMKASSFYFETKTVKLNRPFVYAIVDNATKLPVFIGTVNNI